MAIALSSETASCSSTYFSILIAEVAACMVVDHIEDHGDPMHVRQIHQRLQLVHLALQVRLAIRRQAPRRKHRIGRCDIGRQFGVRHCEVRFRREVVQPVVAEAEGGGELLDGQELQRGDPEVGKIGEPGRDVERATGALANAAIAAGDAW